MRVRVWAPWQRCTILASSWTCSLVMAAAGNGRQPERAYSCVRNCRLRRCRAAWTCRDDGDFTVMFGQSSAVVWITYPGVHFRRRQIIRWAHSAAVSLLFIFAASLLCYTFWYYSSDHAVRRRLQRLPHSRLSIFFPNQVTRQSHRSHLNLSNLY